MQLINTLRKSILLMTIISGSVFRAYAQLPTCTGPSLNLVYVHTGTAIYNFDPAQPFSATNPSLNTITCPAGAGGLAVNPNLNAATPSPTFYTTVGGTYWYYNGAGWTNTGHTAGSVNPGGAGPYIYNLGGNVFRYDGTGNSITLPPLGAFPGIADVIGDCAGNFYLMKTTAPQALLVYDPNATLINTYTVTGAPNTSGGGGFAIIGNNLYYHNVSNYFSGVITGGTIAVSQVNPQFTFTPLDFAQCPIGGIAVVNASIDTGYYCGSGPGIPVSVSGSGPFTWTVLSGNAVVTGSGSSVTITATSGVSKVEVTGTGGSIACASSGKDTVTVIVPSGLADAGPDTDTIIGCGSYSKVLNGSLTNTMSFLTYNISWTPAASITSGANTLTPLVNPAANTNYILTVSTPANQGGCTWSDSILVAVKDSSVTADFSFDIRYGCAGDTVDFTNLSQDIITHLWEFGDNTGDTVLHPSHVYTAQAVHNVKLVVSNGKCVDSIIKPVDHLHPLDADFTVDDDSVCQGQLITFTNTSVTTTKNGIDPVYFWDFGDGSTSTLQSPTHVFTKTGVFQVMMAVTDFVPCSDTAWKTIVVDSVPHARIISDSVLCEGQGLIFTADYLTIGNTGITWEFGDGTVIKDQNPITHAFDTSGIFAIKLTASYRLCNDTFATKQVEIRPFPQIDLGNDTVMCPNGDPIVIADKINKLDPAATWIWNTGAKTSSITVRHPGVYSATVSMNKCTTTDSVEVFKHCYLDIPNSFTPNGDGINDYFLPRQLLSGGLAKFRMQVFNRWGQVIFETSSTDGRGWDGTFNNKAQPQGVYVYLIEAEFINNTSEKYQGNITLLR